MMAGILRRATRTPLSDMKNHPAAAQTMKDRNGGQPRLATHAKIVAESARMEAIERSIAPVKMIPVSAKAASAAGAISGPRCARMEENELPSFSNANMTM